MSERKARLCDVEESRWSSVGNKTTLISCDNVAVSKCVLCDRDACAAHTMHPQGGLKLKLESIGLDTTVVPSRDIPFGANPQNPQNQPGAYPVAVRISVCSSCWASVHDDFSDALESIRDNLVSWLRAKLAERSLTAKDK
jgi:hypothetical protein